MKNDKHEQNELQRMMEGRAARMIAAAVTVFLCVLTLFEFVALKMEWNVPALAVLSGDNGLWTREYQREELVMDGSTENILLADVDRAVWRKGIRICVKEDGLCPRGGERGKQAYEGAGTRHQSDQ